MSNLSTGRGGAVRPFSLLLEKTMSRSKSSQKRREQRKRAEMRATEITEKTATINYLFAQPNTAAPTPVAYYEVGQAYVPKKENNMSSYSNAQVAQITRPTETEQQRDYFLGRLLQLAHEKERQELKHFGMVDDDPPKTPKEYVQRIKDNKFMIQKDCDDMETGRYSWEYLIWRDPEVKRDQDGYTAARELIHKVIGETEDEIWNDPKNALAAVHKFEKHTFH